MPLDASFLGRAYPPTEPYLVTRERIREFAVAIGASDPLFLDPAVAAKFGHPDVVAPPTFLILLTNDAGDKLVRDPALGRCQVMASFVDASCDHGGTDVTFGA